MPTYRVQRTAYVSYMVEVEADNEEEAEELGNEMLGDGKHTDELWGDWTTDPTYVDEISEFVYVPTPTPPAEEPDLVY